MKLLNVKKNSLLALLLCGFIYNVSNAQKLVKPAVEDQLFPAASVQMGGFIGKKLDLSYENRILAQDIDKFIEPFQNKTEERCWQTEFWGKWFTSAVLAYRYKPDPRLKSVLDLAVDELLKTQTKDGYIGNYAGEHRLEKWDIWGRKYVMLGLIDYYDLTDDKKSLIAARNAADHLISELQTKEALIVTKGGHRGMAASSVLEPITKLYVRTNEKRYLDFAEEIVRQWETQDGPQLISKADVDVALRFPKPEVRWMSWEQGQKAYEMMSCYEGLLELYRITGNEAYRSAVEKTWENIKRTEINIAGSGASVECWYGGHSKQTQVARHYQETCVTATWIKLSQQLLRLTGEAKYADAIEQSYYNALLSSMKSDGSTWAKYSPLIGIKHEGGDQCNMGSNCCVVSGPRGQFTLPLTTVMSEKEGISINFYNEGTYKLQSPKGQPIEVVQQTEYPVTGKIKLKIVIPKDESFSISLRIPNWSERSFVTVNDQSVNDITPGEYLTLDRAWKSDDVINLTLDMRGRAVLMGPDPGHVAILRGPVVLARDSRIALDVDVDEIIMPGLDEDGFVPLELISTNEDNIWMKFRVSAVVGSYLEGEHGQPVSITFCDYISAGNTYDSGSRFRVWFPQLLDPRKSNPAISNVND